MPTQVTRNHRGNAALTNPSATDTNKDYNHMINNTQQDLPVYSVPFLVMSPGLQAQDDNEKDIKIEKIEKEKEKEKEKEIELLDDVDEEIQLLFAYLHTLQASQNSSGDNLKEVISAYLQTLANPLLALVEIRKLRLKYELQLAEDRARFLASDASTELDLFEKWNLSSHNANIAWLFLMGTVIALQELGLLQITKISKVDTKVDLQYRINQDQESAQHLESHDTTAPYSIPSTSTSHMDLPTPSSSSTQTPSFDREQSLVEQSNDTNYTELPSTSCNGVTVPTGFKSTPLERSQVDEPPSPESFGFGYNGSSDSMVFKSPPLIRPPPEPNPVATPLEANIDTNSFVDSTTDSMDQAKCARGRDNSNHHLPRPIPKPPYAPIEAPLENTVATTNFPLDQTTCTRGRDYSNHQSSRPMPKPPYSPDELPTQYHTSSEPFPTPSDIDRRPPPLPPEPHEPTLTLTSPTPNPTVIPTQAHIVNTVALETDRNTIYTAALDIDSSLNIAVTTIADCFVNASDSITFEAKAKRLEDFKLLCQRFNITMDRQLASPLSPPTVLAHAPPTVSLCDLLEAAIDYHSSPKDLDLQHLLWQLDTLADRNSRARTTSRCIALLPPILGSSSWLTSGINIEQHLEELSTSSLSIDLSIMAISPSDTESLLLYYAEVTCYLTVLERLYCNRLVTAISNLQATLIALGTANVFDMSLVANRSDHALAVLDSSVADFAAITSYTQAMLSAEHIFEPHALETALINVQDCLEVIDLDSAHLVNTGATQSVALSTSGERSPHASSEGEFNKYDEAVDHVAVVTELATDSVVHPITPIPAHQRDHGSAITLDIERIDIDAIMVTPTNSCSIKCSGTEIPDFADNEENVVRTDFNVTSFSPAAELATKRALALDTFNACDNELLGEEDDDSPPTVSRKTPINYGTATFGKTLVADVDDHVIPSADVFNSKPCASIAVTSLKTADSTLDGIDSYIALPVAGDEIAQAVKEATLEAKLVDGTLAETATETDEFTTATSRLADDGEDTDASNIILVDTLVSNPFASPSMITGELLIDDSKTFMGTITVSTGQSCSCSWSLIVQPISPNSLSMTDSLTGCATIVIEVFDTPGLRLTGLTDAKEDVSKENNFSTLRLSHKGPPLALLLTDRNNQSLIQQIRTRIAGILTRSRLDRDYFSSSITSTDPRVQNIASGITNAVFNCSCQSSFDAAQSLTELMSHSLFVYYSSTELCAQDIAAQTRTTAITVIISSCDLDDRNTSAQYIDTTSKCASIIIDCTNNISDTISSHDISDPLPGLSSNIADVDDLVSLDSNFGSNNITIGAGIHIAYISSSQSPTAALLILVLGKNWCLSQVLFNRLFSFALDDEEPSDDQDLVAFEEPLDDHDLAAIKVMVTTRIALRRVKNTITFKFDIVLDDTTVSIIVSIDCLDTEHPAQSTHSTATTTTRYGTRLIDATRSDTVTVHADIFPDFAAIVKQLLFLFGRHTTIRNELDLVYVNHDAVLEHFVVALGTSCNTSLPIPTEIADTDANVVSLDVHEALAILQPFVFDHRMRTLYYATTSDSANSSDTSAPATTPTDISTVPPCLNTIDATGDILDIGTTASHTPNAETVETEVIDTPDTVTLSSDTSITNRHNSLVSTRPVPAITTSCMSKADIDPPSRDASETANPDTDEQMIFLNNLLEQNQSLKAKFLDLKNILIDHLISSNSDSNDSSAHLTTDSSKSVTPTHDLVSEGVQTIVANQVNHNATLILDHDLNLNALRSMTTGVMSKATTWRTVFDATQAICDDIRFDLNTLLSESTLIESLQADDSFTFNSIARRCQILFDQQAALCKDIDSIHADRDTLLEHLASVSENLYALCQNGLSICSNSVDTTDFLVEYCTSFVEAFDITINQLTGFINALDVALSSNDFDTLIVTGQHITAHVQTLVKLLDKQFDLCCFDIQLLNQRLLKYQNDIVENLTSSQLDCDPTSSSLDHNAQCIVSEITSSVSNRSTRSYDDATRSTEATMPHCLGKSIDTGSLTAMPNVLAVECAVYYVREVTTLVFSVSSNHLVPDSVTYQEVLSWIKDALATKTHDTLPLFKEYLLSRYNKLKLFLQSDLSCT